MRARRVRGAAATGVAVLGLLVPAAAATAAAGHGAERSGGEAVRAEGDFVASVDFATLRARSVGDLACELTVDGTLTFSGTVEGAADGVTTALVLAPCAEVLASPAGTVGDVFTFRGHFRGEVLDAPASGPLRYAGVTRAGGRIDAVITLRGQARALLRAEAQVAVGGSYEGMGRSGG